jgi:hypothetical protein
MLNCLRSDGSVLRLHPRRAAAELGSWGGKEVEADGKTVALNSKETVESVKFAVAFWNDCYDPGGLAWMIPATTGLSLPAL